MTMSNRRQVVFVIMDGLAQGIKNPLNAVLTAHTPTLDELWGSCPTVNLGASGEDVGLPEGVSGNSEAGHITIGAGRTVAQGAVLIDDAISDGALFTADEWQEVLSRGRSGKTVHLCGLLQDEPAHSDVKHLYALLEKLASQGVNKVRVHAILDGRDSAPGTGKKFLQELEELLDRLLQAGLDYKIASIQGRGKGIMQRYDENWQRVLGGTNAIVHGLVSTSSRRKFKNSMKAYHYHRKVGEEFFPPTVIVDNETKDPIGKVEEGDVFIWFNYRGDRSIQFLKLLEKRDLSSVPEAKRQGINIQAVKDMIPDNLYILGLIEVDGDEHLPSKTLLTSPTISDTLYERVSAAGLKGKIITETAKFGHVARYVNGVNNLLPQGFDALEIASSGQEPHEDPNMSADAITDALLELIGNSDYNLLVTNIVNGDMVGHTGDFTLSLEAVRKVDECLARLKEACDRHNAILIVTADHGNVDDMSSPGHTSNPVQFSIYDPLVKFNLVDTENWQEHPGLANIASSIAAVLGIEASPLWKPSVLW